MWCGILELYIASTNPSNRSPTPMLLSLEKPTSCGHVHTKHENQEKAATWTKRIPSSELNHESSVQEITWTLPLLHIQAPTADTTNIYNQMTPCPCHKLHQINMLKGFEGDYLYETSSLGFLADGHGKALGLRSTAKSVPHVLQKLLGLGKASYVSYYFCLKLLTEVIDRDGNVGPQN